MCDDVDLIFINLFAGSSPQRDIYKLAAGLGHFNELIHLSTQRVPEFKILNEL